MTFRDGTQVRAIISLNAHHRARFTTSKLQVGTHPMTATYNGNKKNQGSVSAIFNQVVQ